MITVIKSDDLKTNTDMVCTHCGKNHNIRDLNGKNNEKEGIDYVFETDGIDEWCICLTCKNDCDNEKVNS